MTDDRQRLETAKLRAVQRLCGLAFWEIDLSTGFQEWSNEMYQILGIGREDLGQTQKEFFAFIHPDDREAANVCMFAQRAGEGAQIEQAYRIIRPDGETIHVRSVYNIADMSSGKALVGVTQDMTNQLHASSSLREAKAMTRLACRVARLGGWRFEIHTQTVHWSDEAAAIHEEPAGTSPVLSTALSYYPSGHREVMEKCVSECVSCGAPFDQVLQIVTASNRLAWVRVIGEPESDLKGNIIGLRGAIQDLTDTMDGYDDSSAMIKRLAQVLRNMGEAFFVLDSDWKFAFLNRRTEQTLNRPRDDLIGKVIWDALGFDPGSLFHSELERSVSTGKPAHFRSCYMQPSMIWLDVSAHPTPEGLAVYLRDVTADHLRSEQLRLLELAVAHLNDMLVITEIGPLDEPDGPKIVFVNDAVVRTTGYSRESLIGATPRMFQGEATQRSELDRIRMAIEARIPVRAELTNYTVEQHEYWIDLSINPIMDAAGQVTHMVAVNHDITDRKRSELALRSSEERFRLISDVSDAVVWDRDFENGSTWYNRNMETLFGYPAGTQAPMEQTWHDRIHPDDLHRVVESLQNSSSGDAMIWEEEYRFRKSEGEMAIVRNRGFFIRGTNGKPLRLVGSFLDVTVEHARQAELRQSQKLEAMGQLTGGVAHDFNNILTIIMGTSELIAEGTVDPGLRKLADVVVQAAERGASLTSQLLAFARKQPLIPQSVDVNARIASIDYMLRRTLPDNVEILFQPADDLGAAELDPSQLDVALLNLAINARDAMPDGGQITIKTANMCLDEASRFLGDVAPGPYIKITVTDQGSGMTPEIVTRVFEPFFTTKLAGLGTGLGLSMVYGFVKQSRGQIGIESLPGKGTTFAMYFPRASVASDKAPIPAHVALRNGFEQILVVEDDDQVREYVVQLLHSLDYRVAQASNGARGLEVLAETPGIDLLLTDVLMPNGMSGRQLANLARERFPGLRVLFMSGYSDDELSRNGYLDEGVELLKKPFRRLELATKVRVLLDGGKNEAISKFSA